MKSNCGGNGGCSLKPNSNAIALSISYNSSAVFLSIASML